MKTEIRLGSWTENQMNRIKRKKHREDAVFFRGKEQLFEAKIWHFSCPGHTLIPAVRIACLCGWGRKP